MSFQKGKATLPTSWRGIAKKSACYKLLSSLLTRRLSNFCEATGVIPNEQHGFRRGHSTMTACSALLDDVKQALAKPSQPLYAVFVDFRAAFDSAPRNIVLRLLAEAGVPPKVLNLLVAILQENNICIDDGVAELPPFTQTTGVAQGDNLSPLLFSVLLKDLPSRVRGPRELVKVILYADDLVVYGLNRFQVQQTLARLHTTATELGLTVNQTKTVAMKFRRGGRIAAGDELRLAGSPLAYVSKFPYLGLLLSPNGRSFRAHVTERCRMALTAVSTIRKPQLLSVPTALRLFDLKVAPMAAYGAATIWDDLTPACLEQLNRVKATYLKRVLGLHRVARNRLVYLLADTPLFIEELRHRFDLPTTPSFKEVLSTWEAKFADIDADFLNSGAMRSQTWKEGNRSNRHVVTRYAVHGYHHKLCATLGYHEPRDSCRCLRCNQLCNRYHAAHCGLVSSLASLA